MRAVRFLLPIVRPLLFLACCLDSLVVGLSLSAHLGPWSGLSASLFTGVVVGMGGERLATRVEDALRGPLR